jgi:hypothetical protein
LGGTRLEGDAFQQVENPQAFANRSTATKWTASG